MGIAPKEVRVHVLSEHVYCPRAAILALESGEDDGEDEPRLGPRLDGFADYDEHRFVDELRAAWSQFRLWFTLIAPAALLVLIVWRLVSPVWGIAVSLPIFFLVAQLWDSGGRIVALVRERAKFAAAVPTNVDVTSQQIREVNWWSLRKAGFDCRKPVDPHRDPAERLVGKPWRVLTKGTTLRIPVIRKHRGERVWRPQHIVRIAAYCRLIETSEGGESPFGVLMFADSYECVIIPNTAGAKFQFEKAMEDVREFLGVYEGGKFVPTEPTDNRCSGCHWGKPCKYVAGETDTILDGNPLTPLRTKAKNAYFHCPCGDRFHWVPPHDDAVALGIVEGRR
jgi:hypothetical protein